MEFTYKVEFTIFVEFTSEVEFTYECEIYLLIWNSDILFTRHTFLIMRNLMPQSHTHLRTLQMIRKAHPHRSVHSITIRNY